ncbi:glutaminyl-peptide cyclotransferase [Dyadobacter sp. NIV53]|uniref:glutaminyl-peptide cyclotransferase n=1 Tax=Dyadobacter sp. NIV53 TaxID=2861765 RepID=UPI001C87A241|nr:glutaminyl-peptide cyclotransferase [Dyadobacter sp. NIV53]
MSSDNTEKAALASLSTSRYVIGDSVRIRLSQSLSKVNVVLDGKLMLENQNGSDSLQINSMKEKTGWHKLIVSGIDVNKVAFSDTLAFELISNVFPQEIKYTVLGQFPHQKTSFTEGLEFYKGELYESTGENGKSQLLKIDLKTGSSLKSISLDKQYFGEGITIVNDNIYQLTWQSGVCFQYDLDFKLQKTFTYYFQGWGLTHHDSTLIMSDGSNKIHFYNTDFEKTGDLEVYDNKGPVRNLNELEYVDGFIYANIFETNKIVKIDAITGKIIAFINMDSIIPAEIDSRRDVLNGIAYRSDEGAFYITGKNWPLLFKIRLKDLPKVKQLASASE